MNTATPCYNLPVLLAESVTCVSGSLYKYILHTLAESVLTSTCSGHFIDQKPRFGILQNNGYPNNPVGNKDGCYWAIYRDKNTPEEIEVTVHEAYSVEGQHVCDSQFLQVYFVVITDVLISLTLSCTETFKSKIWRLFQLSLAEENLRYFISDTSGHLSRTTDVLILIE